MPKNASNIPTTTKAFLAKERILPFKAIGEVITEGPAELSGAVMEDDGDDTGNKIVDEFGDPVEEAIQREQMVVEDVDEDENEEEEERTGEEATDFTTGEQDGWGKMRSSKVLILQKLFWDRQRQNIPSPTKTRIRFFKLFYKKVGWTARSGRHDQIWVNFSFIDRYKIAVFIYFFGAVRPSAVNQNTACKNYVLVVTQLEHCAINSYKKHITRHLSRKLFNYC